MTHSQDVLRLRNESNEPYTIDELRSYIAVLEARCEVYESQLELFRLDYENK
jgi:hypothetical protein